ncbi:hypothetical protein TRICI_000648 [Trichomonascus ciferrii]|uniref:Glucose-6-phosphate 1-epimerase n=1 Tax=Trichomonascus ciferrii TaxID=44093 RepID=A0A642VBU7_9ASCO|nr:hypothetical protein TRICI_000648 [Trichomonascus ciferrii]
MGIEQSASEVKLTTSGGASVRILRFGATVLSWKTTDGQEQLWLSEKAILDGSKAVRGGIPLVFPVFGKATEGPCANLPQHGFARNHEWEFLGQVNESPLTVQFGLGPENLSAAAKEQWGYDFTLIYTITLEDDKLTTALTVENTDKKPFDFNVLYHTYFRIPDISSVHVEGLSGAAVVDKVSKSNYSAEETNVTVAGEVDRVYQDVNPSPVKIVSNGKPKLSLENRKNLPDMVVWNPWTEKAEGLADFYPKDGFKQMICAETGAVGKWVPIQPGEKWESSQTLEAHL